MRTTKPRVNTPGDSHEQEADRIADSVLHSPEGQSEAQSHTAGGDPVHDFMEPRFGHDFSKVKVHTDGNAATLSNQLGARAFTYGNDIYMGAGQYQPGTPGGHHLLAHELSHVIQQEQMAAPMIQRKPGGPNTQSPAKKPLDGPLDNREEDLVEYWLKQGGVYADKFNYDFDFNALLVAEYIFCNRFREDLNRQGEDPGLCMFPDITRADPRVKSLIPLVRSKGEITPFCTPLIEDEWELITTWLSQQKVGQIPLTDDAGQNASVVAEGILNHRYMGGVQGVVWDDRQVRIMSEHVTQRGPLINWPSVSGEDRMVTVMKRLVEHYGYPVNGAAGIVGNLWAESKVIPSSVEGSKPDTPLTARGFKSKKKTKFTPQQVMERHKKKNKKDKQESKGPYYPGVGLAQWTDETRRKGLFEHEYEGIKKGAAILFDMDAQIDYLVAELKSRYGKLNNILTGKNVSLNNASDHMVYDYERPGSVLKKVKIKDSKKTKWVRRKRSEPEVQKVFKERRTLSQKALDAYNKAKAKDKKKKGEKKEEKKEEKKGTGSE